MMADIRDRLQNIPFRPFLIRTLDGHEYSVQAVDYALITPRGNRVVVVTDDGATNVLGPLHINKIIDQQANGE